MPPGVSWLWAWPSTAGGADAAGGLAVLLFCVPCGLFARGRLRRAGRRAGGVPDACSSRRLFCGCSAADRMAAGTSPASRGWPAAMPRRPQARPASRRCRGVWGRLGAWRRWHSLAVACAVAARNMPGWWRCADPSPPGRAAQGAWTAPSANLGHALVQPTSREPQMAAKLEPCSAGWRSPMLRDNPAQPALLVRIRTTVPPCLPPEARSLPEAFCPHRRRSRRITTRMIRHLRPRRPEGASSMPRNQPRQRAASFYAKHIWCPSANISPPLFSWF